MKSIAPLLFIVAFLMITANSKVQLTKYKHYYTNGAMDREQINQRSEVTQDVLKNQNFIEEPTERSLGDYPSYSRTGGTANK